MLNDYFLSIVRTYVPVGVHFEVVLDENTSGQLAVAVTALVVAGYYGLVRALETQWPWFGKLLGRQAQPAYVEARR